MQNVKCKRFLIFNFSFLIKKRGCEHLYISQFQFRLSAASPRHKPDAQKLQLWAFRYYRGASRHPVLLSKKANLIYVLNNRV